MGKEGRFRLQVRAEFQNIFNRMAYSLPSDGSAFGAGAVFTTTPTAHANAGGTLSSGYGFVPWVNGVGIASSQRPDRCEVYVLILVTVLIG